MHPFPHHYAVRATARPAGSVALDSAGLPALPSDGPAEFDGPGTLWSPETLLTAALADCFVLSFRAVAAASRFDWRALHCEAEGTLDRIERVTQFTGFRLHARLELPAGADEARARRLLEKAEQVCLISASLKAAIHLEIELVTAAD
jgi:organic hydroperoxide reductase OsmC/OhrA